MLVTGNGKPVKKNNGPAKNTAKKNKLKSETPKTPNPDDADIKDTEPKDNSEKESIKASNEASTENINQEELPSPPIKVTPEIQKFISDEIAKHISSLPKPAEQKAKVETVEDIANDILDEPVAFYVLSSYYSFFGGDVVNGKQVPIPFNKPYKFRPLYTMKKSNGEGRGDKTVSIACCLEDSKTRVEWMRKYIKKGRGFGKIFENMNAASSADSKLSEKINAYSRVVSKMDDFQVIRTARDKGMDISKGAVALRAELRDAMVQEDVERQRKNSKSSYYREIMKEAEGAIAPVQHVPASIS